jgi:hypothetical protein
VQVTFSGIIFEWRGPSPFYFVAVPEDIAEDIAVLAPSLTYGWGVIPASVTVGATTQTTSLFPKDGGYLVPLKVALRTPLALGAGDSVTMTLQLGN